MPKSQNPKEVLERQIAHYKAMAILFQEKGDNIKMNDYLDKLKLANQELQKYEQH